MFSIMPNWKVFLCLSSHINVVFGNLRVSSAEIPGVIDGEDEGAGTDVDEGGEEGEG